MGATSSIDCCSVDSIDVYEEAIPKDACESYTESTTAFSYCEEAPPVAAPRPPPPRFCSQKALILILLVLTLLLSPWLSTDVFATSSALLTIFSLHEWWRERQKLQVHKKVEEVVTNDIVVNQPESSSSSSARPPNLWLLLCKYDWGLCYRVNLNADGRVNAMEPLRLGWKRIKQPLESLPQVEDVNSLFYGAFVSCDRDIWHYKVVDQREDEVVVQLNIAKQIRLIVRANAIDTELPPRRLERARVTHTWVYLDYIFGVPNMASVKVSLWDKNTVVLSHEDAKLYES